MRGQQLGPWILEEEVGHGGMGAVWRARRAADAPGEPTVAAVKVLATDLANETGFLERFRREIDILRGLEHRNIVRFLGSGDDGGRFWFAMEYVDGPSLETLREQRGPMEWRDVLDVALQVAPALKHAHDRGVIHRDLKPSNLLRAPDGTIKLTDFGIASLFASRHLTVTGSVVGTAEFLSPEQAAGKPVTPRSDLYSLGVVLYTLVTGRPPFTGRMVDLLHKHRYGQFEQPSRLVPDLPPDFEAVIVELLAKDPGRRPPDAGVLYRRLEGLRRRLEYRSELEAAEAETVHGGGGEDEGHVLPAVGLEGPATLMSRLMRAELERQNRGGRVQQFFNHPAVIVILFVLSVGTLAWTFWPADAEELYRKGTALMDSSDLDDQERGWTEYLSKLQEKFPDNAHRDDVAAYHRRYEAIQAERAAARAARNAGPMSEAQWFYQEGLRRRQRGDEAAARRVWRALVEAFGEVPSEGPWVRLAQKELGGDGGDTPRQLEPLREALRRARELRREGKTKQADAIEAGLKELYRDDPGALERAGKD
jgi:serine/threonine-protein kinase